VLAYGCPESSVRFATVDLPGWLGWLAHAERADRARDFFLLRNRGRGAIVSGRRGSNMV